MVLPGNGPSAASVAARIGNWFALPNWAKFIDSEPPGSTLHPFGRDVSRSMGSGEAQKTST
jgi:hypothetical protein